MSSNKLQCIPLQQIERARSMLDGHIVRTPLIKLNSWSKDSSRQIYLKLESLQPIGSFKIRGALNAVTNLPREKLARGIYTASAGNFAQGLVWACGKRDIQCNVVVPDNAPKTKLEAIQQLGGSITKVPFDVWWKVIKEHKYPEMSGTFIHPVSEIDVMAGNGTIGLEILEDLPDVDAVLVPYGGGGLTTGIASAIKASKPDVKIYACEVDTAAPLSASFKAGKPTPCNYEPTFIDGIGGKEILEEMWPYVSSLVDDALTVTLKQAASAVKLLAERNRVIVEGAGAVPVAAALTGKAGDGNIVCIVSGGNIDTDKFISILQGNIP